jgi:uncharacterized protein CbrC (UPF0167 family)
MSGKGIVYILTNPCLDGWVKIGMSDKDDIQDRLDELNNPSNIPLSFRAYALYHVENPLAVEKSIHNLIDTIDDTLRSIEQKDNGRSRIREFFKISPEKAFEIFKQIAQLRGDAESLQMIQPTEVEQKIDEIIQQKRPRLNLKEIGIPNGTTLNFVNDETITCVADIEKNKLLYEGNLYSLSALAIKLLNEKCGWSINSIAGGSYFKYKGETLNDIRNSKEISNEN